MESTRLIDGKSLAAQWRHVLAAAIHDDLLAPPTLAIIQVGAHPASSVYVRNKLRSAEASGLMAQSHQLAHETSQTALEKLITQLNRDPQVHGLLLQLPLPDHLRAEPLFQLISPAKDVDGFHPENVGKLWNNKILPPLLPCTAVGILALIRKILPDISGKNALVIGRSTIAGKPAAALLLRQDATVTIAHSRSQNLELLCSKADILVAAVGRAEFIRGNWLQESCVAIDVGINKMLNDDGSHRLVGDIDYASAWGKIAALTPVPGGVGPMTIACLLRNCVIAACQQMRKPTPESVLNLITMR